ncbi:hypothetical protein LCL95_09335 [Bacillus timonensis]|nr:hypothetical protein [Bacillus timonensis]
MRWFKEVHHVKLRKINRALKKLAESKMELEERIQNGKIKIELDPLQATQYSGVQKKKEIEEAITELEGYETFRICLFKECTVTYKEQLVFHQLSRWIEIAIDIPESKRKVS